MLDLSVSTRSVAGIDLVWQIVTRRLGSMFFLRGRDLAIGDANPDIQLLRFIRNGELAGGIFGYP